MDKKYLLLGGGLLITLVLGVVFPRPIVQETRKLLGAMAGPVIDSRVVNIGGSDVGFVGAPTTGTSSVLCAIKNPFNATSTIDRFTFQNTSGFAGAVTYDISTSTNASGAASSTPALVYANSIGAGLQSFATWYPQASSTPTAFNQIYDVSNPYARYLFLRNNEYVTVRIATSSPGNETIKGYCNAKFTKL